MTMPFEEIEHTADIAFRVYGTTMQELATHAQQALCSKFPELTSYADPMPEDLSLDQIIMRLNDMITRADTQEGCGLKAISFHGDVKEDADGVLTWEMILDV